MAEDNGNGDSGIGVPVFQMAPETQELLKAAKKLEPGQTMPNSDICAVTGRSLDECVGIACTVAKHILRDHDRVVVFHPVRYGGLHCLTDAERVEFAATSMKQVGRKLKKTARVVVGAKDENLTDDQRLHKTGIGTLCKLLTTLHSKSKQVAKLIQPDQPLRIGETITKLFGGGNE